MATSTATILFTDLVASTELSVRHGPRFDDARRAHDGALRSAVESNGGKVVKSTGDGIMATFGAASDGVAAARAAQQSIRRLNLHGHGPQLSIRVGLSVGDVSFEDADCYGTPVIEAARLCAVADGDQILATDRVRAVAGDPHGSGLDPRPPVELKGLPEPVAIVEVHWDRLQRSPVPLPSRLARSDAAFVGRGPELGELRRDYDTVWTSNRRRVVLVGGEAGLGKTSLVAEAARGWYEDGATVAMGGCEEDVRAPYRPFVAALDQLVSAAPAEVLHGHVERHGAGLLPLAPGLTSRLDRVPPPIATDPETERFLLFAAVEDLLATLTQQGPVVLFLDDLHWADAGTASLLRSLATAADPARLLVVGTFRIDELRAEHPMGQTLAALRRTPAVSRIQLGGLGSDDVVRLLEHWAGGGVEGAEQLAVDLVAETGGNAFFLTEVVRHLEETGQLGGGASGSAARAVMPDSIREVLGERVARLGSAADEVLAVAAVIGSEFGLPVLTAVTGLADEKVLGILTDAMGASLVREVVDSPGRFHFTHALVQHAILANVGPTRETSLHRRVAEVLEADHRAGSPVAELAHHWYQATLRSDGARARDWARQAGDEALAGLAPADAVGYYRQALLLHDGLRDDDEPTRIDLLIKLGAAERQAGEAEHRDTLLKACRLARRAGDGRRLAMGALANHSGTFTDFGAVDAGRVDMLESAISSAADDGQRALLQATLANELTYAGDRARIQALSDDATRAARATADTGLLLRVLNLLFFPLQTPDRLDQRLAMTEESLELMALVEDPVPRYWAAKGAWLNLLQAGRADAAAPHLETLRALTKQLAQPALEWRTRLHEAARSLLAGDPDGAERAAIEAHGLGDQAADAAATVYFRSQRMCVHWLRGTLEELSARIRGTGPRPSNAAASLCVIFAEGGREEDARAVLAQAAEDQFAHVPRDPAFLYTLSLFAEGAMLLNEPAPAKALHGLLRPFAGQVGFDGVTSVGSIEHQLGTLATLLGRHDEAVERLRRSIGVHERIAAPFFEARSRHQLAVALLERSGPGDAGEARDELRRAGELAAGRQYRMVHRRAAELLMRIDGS